MILSSTAVSDSNAAVRELPPQDLVNLLARLGLARAEQVHGVRGRVRRLARDLPAFESVWVDALAQARVLTPYQALEINAGRGAALEVGPFVLHQPLASPGYARVFRALQRQSGRWVRLSIIACPAGGAAEIAARLKALVQRSAGLSTASNLLPVLEHGMAGGKLWAAANDIRGQTAAEWMIHHGRFPPAAVLEIAQQMLAGLLACEHAELVHGDLRPGQVLLDSHGKVWLPEPGLRLAVRPDEGFGHADLPPEAYECLAPERVSAGAPADTAGDVYACGCLWWHLLTGRPAIPGATSLAKLRAAQTTNILDVCHLAPDVSTSLAETVADCLRRDPRQRPDAFRRLAVRLAIPARATRSQLVQSVRRSSHAFRRTSSIAAATRRPAGWTMRFALAAGAVAVAMVGVWPHWGQSWINRWNSTGGESAAQRADAALGAPGQLSAEHAAPLAALPQSVRGSSSGGGREIVQATWTEPTANVLELDAGKLQQLAELPLSDGMTVRAPEGKRATITVPPGGLAVDVEDIRFENADFVSDAAPAGRRGQSAAMIGLRAFKARFTGCSFQSAGASKLAADRLPAAIGWLGRPLANEDELTLPTGELTMERCVFSGVSAAIRCEIEAALTFELSQCLHLGPGPLVVLAEAPQVDEPITLAINHLTLRGASALLECRYDELGDGAGSLAIHAADCAFVPSPGGGLLVFKGTAHPGPLIEHLDWTGQGSVLSREAPLALWHGANGRIRAAAEELIQVAGLVRTEVGFAGDAEAGPGASRIVRWQVPLRSTDPPGIGDEELPWPTAGGH